MEIKVTIAFDERAQQILTDLIAALSKREEKEWKSPAIVETPQNKPVEAKKLKAEETPEANKNAAGKAVSASVAAAENKPVAGKVEVETLRALAADVKKAKGSAAPIKALLDKYGAENITGVMALGDAKACAFRDELKGLL